MESPWITGIVAGSVPLILAILAKLMPYRRDSGRFADVPLDELRRRYFKWELFEIAAVFVFVPLLTWAFYQGLKTLQTLTLPNAKHGEILLTAPAEHWLLIAFFLAIITAVFPLHVSFKCLLKERYAEFLHYGDRRLGIDHRRLLRWLCVIFVTVCTALTVLGLDCYAKFTADSLINSDFLSLGADAHRYADVQEIRRVAKFKAPSGKILARPYFQVLFKDGYLWSSRDLVNDKSEGGTLARRILKLLSDRSGRPIVDYDLAPEQAR